VSVKTRHYQNDQNFKKVVCVYACVFSKIIVILELFIYNIYYLHYLYFTLDLIIKFSFII